MFSPHPDTGPWPESFIVTDGLPRDNARRFMFLVPQRWRSPVLYNPFAAEAERLVIEWFESLGCTPAEVGRVRRFDVAGYVGLPFPSLPPDKTLRTAKYLALWLLWDDVQIETLDNRWRIDADAVLARRRPPGMTRFDEGWWQLLQELAEARSPRWIGEICAAMAAWDAAAVEEAVAARAHRERRALPTFARQMELRTATIGMYATVYLLEDAYDFELPPELHASSAVVRLKRLCSQIVGLGNDILSFGKDWDEDQINLTSTLMNERGLSVDEAIERLIRMHDEALAEFDRLADSLKPPPGTAPIVARWLDDVRYASLGFSLWESQAPRYTAHKVMSHGRLIEPRFSFFPPPSSRRRSAPPPSRRRPAPMMEES